MENLVALTNLPLKATQNVFSTDYDAIVIVANNYETDLKRNGLLDQFADLSALKQLNASFEKEISFAIVNKTRVIYSPTGPLNRDQDDVRVIHDATLAGVKQAVAMGSKSPLLVNTITSEVFAEANQVALQAAWEAVHIPLEVREQKKSPALFKVEKMGFWSSEANYPTVNETIRRIHAVEIGRIVTRDLGGSDPERTSAENIAKYCDQVFAGNANIKCTIIEGQSVFEKEYPLFAAVNRAADVIPRHRGRIVKLEYTPEEGTVDQTLMLVGKGITYDTGGADIKAGGHMAGMHRDKCGAAFVAGFFKTVALLKPKGIKYHGWLCLARNSVGEDAYVADEIIKSRAGKFIRIGNTDAEGRMAMSDSLCEAKEMALTAVNPKLFTIATLTGHVIRAYGPAYTGVMCNGPARRQHVDRLLQDAGDLVADPYEISTIRREDYKITAGRNEYEDHLQATNNASVNEPRGHMFPAAFMIGASGLDKHGNDSEKQLSYTHVDCAGSSGPYPGIPTARPLPSFVQQFVVPRL